MGGEDRFELRRRSAETRGDDLLKFPFRARSAYAATGDDLHDGLVYGGDDVFLGCGENSADGGTSGDGLIDPLIPFRCHV